MKKFAERFNEALKLKEIRQIDVSNKTGIAPGTISNYAQGKYEPHGLNLEKIADALDVNEAWLKGYPAPMEKLGGNIIKLGQHLDKWETDYYSQEFPKIERDEEVTRDELDLLTAYRDAAPAIRAAVRKLLDLPEVKE